MRITIAAIAIIFNIHVLFSQVTFEKWYGTQCWDRVFFSKIMYRQWIYFSSYY